MITPNLFSAIDIHLQEASYIYVAVALLKDFGLNFIEENVPDTCRRKYLVGIHLPTSPSVLRRLLQSQTEQPSILESKIYNGGEVYHPKVYIIQKKNNELVAFIGSANATHGGLSNNIEMSICITDQNQCAQLISWFNNLYSKGLTFDEEYIVKYEATYKKNRTFVSAQKSNIDALTNKASSITGGSITVAPGQFFRQSDFDAYLPKYHLDSSSNAVGLRRNVRERLLELDEMIFPKFGDFGINDLHQPDNRKNYTSYYWHTRGYNHIPQDAIWLNYGKSVNELSKYGNARFTNHIRIQIILRNTLAEAYVGIWLFLGKPNASYEDRMSLKNKLNDPMFIDVLYEYLLELGGAYWISLGNWDDLYLPDLTNKEELRDFLLNDDYSDYFIIGRNYQPDDSDLSEENFPEVALTEFSKLYKIYDLIRDKG